MPTVLRNMAHPAAGRLSKPRLASFSRQRLLSGEPMQVTAVLQCSACSASALALPWYSNLSLGDTLTDDEDRAGVLHEIERGVAADDTTGSVGM